MKTLIALLLYFAAPPSYAQEKVVDSALTAACKKVQPFFADTLETCKDQRNYKKFVEELEEVECPRFSHSFFIVLRTVLENSPYKKDTTCFDKESFDGNLADSLVNEIEVKYSNEFIQLAKHSKLSRDSFMKLPLNLFSSKILMGAGKTFPADSEARKKLMQLSLDKLGAAHHSKKISADDEKTFQVLETETGAKRRAWTSLGHFAISGCKIIQKAYVAVPEETADAVKSDVVLKALLEVAMLQPTGGEVEPPVSQPTPAQLKTITEKINAEAITAWAKSEKVMVPVHLFQKSVAAKNPKWLILRDVLAKALKAHEHQIDTSTVTRCSSN
ncbi:MAG: hypothetical protein H7061_11005 [Bdellovibrionaceae bacterium]|nr:hypothetical protein [Bdellovibrio sp.]